MAAKWTDGDRTVELDDEALLLEPYSDDLGADGGEHGDSADARLLDDRPPHWD